MRRPLLDAPVLGSHGRIIGRPRKTPPVDAVKRIEDLAAEGRTIVGIAGALSVNREVLRRWMQDDAALQDAFDLGRERERHELHTLMLRDARDGEKPNINAMFLLKCRHGYREGDQSEQGSRVSITFNLPGAMTREDFMRSVVATQSAGDEAE